MKKKLRCVYRALLLVLNVNWFKTVYVNFRTLPFLYAIHLPILDYYGYRFDSLRGKVIIQCKPRLGLLKIGYDFDK